MTASDKDISTVTKPSPVSTNAAEREAGQPDMEIHRKLSTVLTKDVVATGNVSVFNPYTVLFFPYKLFMSYKITIFILLHIHK
jgi:hypothetical protein